MPGDSRYSETLKCGCSRITRRSPVAPLTWMLIFSVLAVRSAMCGGAYGEWRCEAGGVEVSSGDFDNATFGPFVSPQVPTGTCAGKYYSDLECEFEFRAPSLHIVYVELEPVALDVDCAVDYIDLDLENTVRRVCGQVAQTYDVADGDRLIVTFKTNSCDECAGFAGFFSSFFDPLARKRRSLPNNNEPMPNAAGHRSKRSSYGHSQELLNYLMTSFREHNAEFLSHCRTRLLNEIWGQDSCSICQCPELKECKCHEPTRDRRRRQTLDSKMVLVRNARSCPGCTCNT